MDIYRLGTQYEHIMGLLKALTRQKHAAYLRAIELVSGLANELEGPIPLGILETVSDPLVANRFHSSHPCQRHAGLAERHLKFVRDEKSRQLPNGSCTYLNGRVRG